MVPQSAERQREIRHARKAAGLCPTCGRRPDGDFITCLDCRSGKTAEDYRREYRKYGESRKAWREKNRATLSKRRTHSRANARVRLGDMVYLERERAKARRAKMACLKHYSIGVIKCACCGEAEPAFLTINHVNGLQSEDRLQSKRRVTANGNLTPNRRRSGSSMYRWLRARGFPSGYNVLCMNCNMAESRGGCPHAKTREN